MLAYLKPIQLQVQLQMMGFSQAQLQVQLQMMGFSQAQLQVQLQLKQINPHSSTTASAKGGLRSTSTAITNANDGLRQPQLQLRFYNCILLPHNCIQLHAFQTTAPALYSIHEVFW